MREFSLLALFIILLTSCDDSGELENQKSNDQDTVQVSKDSLELDKAVDYLYVTDEKSAISHIDSLFKNFSAEDTQGYPHDTINTKPALLILRNQNPDTLQFYLTYFFLKNYRYDLSHSNMGHEIRDQYFISNPKDYIMGIDTLADPILYEFFRLYNPFEEKGISLDSLMKKPTERIGSEIILDWLEKNPRYQNYKLISEELDSIQIIREHCDTSIVSYIEFVRK